MKILSRNPKIIYPGIARIVTDADMELLRTGQYGRKTSFFTAVKKEQERKNRISQNLVNLQDKNSDDKEGIKHSSEVRPVIDNAKQCTKTYCVVKPVIIIETTV